MNVLILIINNTFITRIKSALFSVRYFSSHQQYQIIYVSRVFCLLFPLWPSMSDYMCQHCFLFGISARARAASLTTGSESQSQSPVTTTTPQDSAAELKKRSVAKKSTGGVPKPGNQPVAMTPMQKDSSLAAKPGRFYLSDYWMKVYIERI